MASAASRDISRSLTVTPRSYGAVGALRRAAGSSRFSSAISSAALPGSARCLRPRAVLVDGCEESTAGRLHQVCGRRRDRYPAAPHLHLELDFADGLASRTDRVCAERDYSRWNPGGPRDRLAERIDKAVAGPLGMHLLPFAG